MLRGLGEDVGGVVIRALGEGDVGVLPVLGAGSDGLVGVLAAEPRQSHTAITVSLRCRK